MVRFNLWFPLKVLKITMDISFLDSEVYNSYPNKFSKQKFFGHKKAYNVISLPTLHYVLFIGKRLLFIPIIHYTTFAKQFIKYK